MAWPESKITDQKHSKARSKSLLIKSPTYFYINEEKILLVLPLQSPDVNSDRKEWCSDGNSKLESCTEAIFCPFVLKRMKTLEPLA